MKVMFLEWWWENEDELYSLLVGKTERKRPFGRPINLSEDNITRDHREV